MSSGKGVMLEHFIYGSHEGYRIKAMSKGVDPETCSEALMGYFIPISQSDARDLRDSRIIVPMGDDTILLSHIIPGARDEYMRSTLSNHTVLVPRRMLANGDVTYRDVDTAMLGFETDHGDQHGHMEPLEVPITDPGPALEKLPDLLPKEDLLKMLDYYRFDPDNRVFLFYRKSDPAQRIELAYLLSMLVDVIMNRMKLSIFTDVPYPDARRLFNLVIARSMISIKPGQGWSVVPSSPSSGTRSRELGDDPISRIYGK